MEQVRGLLADIVDSGFQSGFRLTRELRKAAAGIAPRVGCLDAAFRRTISGTKQKKALSAITPGAAAVLIAGGRRAAEFLEQVSYHGRRLAKLNVRPGEVLGALARYDRLIPDHGLEALGPVVRLALNNAYYRVREEEAQAFFDLFRAELEAKDLDDLLARMAEILSRTFRARAARLYLGSHDARRRFILAGSAREKLILEKEWHGRYQSYWSIPFFAGRKPAGLIQLAFATRYEWLPRELELLEAVAERCLAAAEKARLTAEVKQLAAHLLQVEEEERRRLRRELHDEAGQSLLLARLQLEMLEKRAPEMWDGREQLVQTRQVVEHAIVEIRRILAALSPAVLEQLGLASAVRQLSAKLRTLCGAKVILRIRVGERLAREVESAAYRLVQECYHNIARHSGASHVKVSIYSTDHILGLRIEDDGVGFDLDEAMARRNSFGLAGMRERVTLLGGSFEVRSRPGRGTVVAVRLPGRRPSTDPESLAQEA